MASLISFSGLASGIDSSALIKATLDQERAVRLTPLQSKIQTYKDTNDAYGKLKELLARLNTAANKFRQVGGGAVAKSASSSDETIATGIATGGATNGTYAINVSQLARAATFSFNDRFSSATAVINSSINNGAPAADRRVSVQVGTGADQETVDIDLTSTTTISDFVSQFNSTSTKATAAVINVGTSASPSYAISIRSNNQGTSQGNLAISVGSEVTSAGSGAFGASTITQALDAEFTLSGISGTISKASNSISDVVPGLTFNLIATGSATISVNDDKSATSSKMQEFVDAYNALLSFIKDNDLVSQEQDGGNIKNTFGPLSGTSLDENLVSALRSAFTSSSITGHTANTLADLGLATQRDGTLKFDSSSLSSALSNDSEGVEEILGRLGESLGSVDGTIAQYTRFNGLIDGAKNSNTDEISRLNQRIADVEKGLQAQEQSLTARFARLESLIGNLSSQQNSLAQILPR